ncbi:MAG: LCP family protein [Selenomonadaceae bacterium]|nr:LCP family protein [Selenomonadaceae bacterium]
MTNKTNANLKQPQRKVRRKRKLKVFRLIFALVILALFISAVLFVGLGVYNTVGSVYNELVSIYQGYNDRKTAMTGPIDPKFDGYTNILILGVDNGEEGVQNADTILVLSFSNDTGKSRLISIPRDTWINSDSAAGRIGTFYGWGGASLMVRHVSALLGISIHQYIVVDMNTFAELIDVLGGVDIYVEENMDYEDPESGLEIHLGQGYQHLDGYEAQKYLRFRGESLGDVGRVQRQQKFIKSLYAKVLQLETIPKLPAIADIFRNRMETSAEIFDSAHLANVLRKMSSDLPATIMLPGAENEEGAFIPDIEGIDKMISELFPIHDIADDENKGSAAE